MTEPVAHNTSDAGARVTPAALAGRFVYRFSGPAMRNAISYHLAGLGQFELDQQGKISGRHKYSLLPLQGSSAKVRVGSYGLQGRLTVEADGTGAAEITFTCIEGDTENLVGKFHVLVAETIDRLWLVSSGATLETGQPVGELATLEALRIVGR